VAPSTSAISGASGDGRFESMIGPAPDDVLGTERGAIRERQPGSQMEHDPGPAVEDVPRLGQRRADGQARVDRGQRLEQLGADAGAPDIALEGGVELRRLAVEDRHVVLAGRRHGTGSVARGSSAEQADRGQDERAKHDR
jgi:hypothetical protein